MADAAPAPDDPVARACMQEVVALHAAFQAWLGVPAGGQMTRFEAAFDPAFQMVTPEGRRMDRAEVLAFLSAGCGSRGRGFRIAVEEVEAVHVAPPLVLVHYVERQWLFGEENARRSAALLRMGPQGPRWLFVQETRIARAR